MIFRSGTRLSRAKRGEQPTASIPASNQRGDNSSSELIEAPLRRRNPLDAHEFGDGGGSGGAEAFRRTARPRPQ